MNEEDAAATPAIVVMGVAGSGKTAVGEPLATELGLPFGDADAFHPPGNVTKMAAGVPLTDADRWPWLDAIGAAIREAPRGIVVTCSALKRTYRDRIRRAAGREVRFVFLDPGRATLESRLSTRKGHFFPASLLDSQLATLERPGPDEAAFVPPAEGTVAEIVAAVLIQLGRSPLLRADSPFPNGEGEYVFPDIMIVAGVEPPDLERELDCPKRVVIYAFAGVFAPNCAIQNFAIPIARGRAWGAATKVTCHVDCTRRVNEIWSGWKCVPTGPSFLASAAVEVEVACDLEA
jgi:gluconokinase